jgi:rsbT co-antagonist protein RsbR
VTPEEAASRIAALEAKLVEREGRFAALISGLQVGVVVQGPASEILLANAKALELLGVSEDQLRGKTSLDPRWDIVREDGRPFPGEDRPVFQALRLRVPIRDVVIGVRRPDEPERVWLLVTAMPQLHADGSIVQVVATFTDITQRRRVEALVHAQLRRIRELSTPLIPIEDGVLVSPLVGEIDRERADQLLETLLVGIVSARARVVILDVTGVPQLDDQACEALQRCVGAVRLLGARLLLTGVRPTVAATLVDRHVDLAGLVALSTLQQGIAAARVRR